MRFVAKQYTVNSSSFPEIVLQKCESTLCKSNHGLKNSLAQVGFEPATIGRAPDW